MQEGLLFSWGMGLLPYRGGWEGLQLRSFSLKC